MVGGLLNADEMVVGEAVGAGVAVVLDSGPGVLGPDVQDRDDAGEDGEEAYDE